MARTLQNATLTSMELRQPFSRSIPRVVARGVRRGFTLVEMMIVVAIVGILAVLAVVGYRRLISSSHVSEATHMVGAIRIAEEAVHAETSQYVKTANSLDTPNLYPAGTPGQFKCAWGASCAAAPSSAIAGTWNTLPVHSDGPVEFGYAVFSDIAGTTDYPAIPTVSGRISGNTITWPATTSVDWYVISAKGDTNGNGIYCTVIGSSFTNDIFVDQDGE